MWDVYVMIISEKQIIQLMQFSQVYLNALERLHDIEKSLLTPCGLHNRVEVAKLLMQIANQQSEELKVIE